MDLVQELVHKIVLHYEALGGYRFVPTDLELCITRISSQDIKVIQVGQPVPGAGYYNNSLTVDPFVNSSIDGKVLANPRLGPTFDLYWIRQSQGYANARIVAHLYDLDSQAPSAFVVGR